MFKKNDKTIVGSGFIAKYFKKYLKILKKYNYVVYAAGVSNSLSGNLNNFKKDVSRINNYKLDKEKKIVYISSYAVHDPSRKINRYIKNKIIIERVIKKKFDKYIILRFPELIGKSKNKNTLSNFFYDKIKKKTDFNLWVNSKRNLLDVEDAIKLSMYYLIKNKKKKIVFNILNIKFYKPMTIVNTLERILKRDANYKINNKHFKNWNLKNSVNYRIAKKLNIKFDNKYLFKKLKKYYLY